MFKTWNKHFQLQFSFIKFIKFLKFKGNLGLKSPKLITSQKSRILFIQSEAK